MSDSEQYEGWTNRETWAVALHINNDQGWQESVREAIRADFGDRDWQVGQHDTNDGLRIHRAGEIIRENVTELFDTALNDPSFRSEDLLMAMQEIGSLWRVNWTELGASFLEDLEDDE